MSERRCMHLFTRRPGWWWHRKSWMRWRCIECGYLTRTYDSMDRMAGRPVHDLMSVAYPGFNTCPRSVQPLERETN